MKKIIVLFFSFILIYNTVTISTGATELPYDIDFSESDQGVVKVLYNLEKDSKIKLIVKNENGNYVYNLENSETYINFPLQLGDGEYTVTIYENTTDNKYRKVYQESKDVVIDDSSSIYLNTIQIVNWDEENEAILLADSLLESAEGEEELTEQEKIAGIYSYIIENIEYDYDKINGLSYDYLPNIDETVETGMGICYDYASLLAAMLRSEGIPTKLVKGYTAYADVYHAWNEIYLAEEDRWIIVDPTYDAYMTQNEFEFDFEKKVEDYEKVNEY